MKYDDGIEHQFAKIHKHKGIYKPVQFVGDAFDELPYDNQGK